MSDERDSEVSRRIAQRYRELAREEPSRELDQTILAAAHRAADRPHAPLVTPAGRHRWYFAFGAAAVLILAVSVTIHMERERPDPEALSVAQAPVLQKVEPPPADKPAAVPDPARVQQEEKASGFARLERERREVQPKAEEQSAPAPAAPAVKPMMNGRMADAVRAEPPERWVERIIELRKQGKHDEAQKQLDEFRRRYPDYKLPDAALKRE